MVGTSVELISGSLNAKHVRNNQILINNQVYTFYSNPDDSTHVQLNESAGYLTSVNWSMQNPTLEGQPLPVVFGPYAGPSGEFYFGLGDPLNPGTLYFTIGNNPESVSDTGYIEVSTPNEPLIGGCILDGRVFVWSDDQSWIILPSFNGGTTAGGSLFYPQLTAMGKGLAAPWAVTAGDKLYWVAWDGIWTSQGDAIQSLTDDSLSPLFRHDATEVYGAPFQGIYPIDFSEAATKWISLTYSKDGLYFTYLGTDANLYSFFYSFLTQGWMQDALDPVGTRYYRGEGEAVDQILIGSSTGLVLQFDETATLDLDGSIPCEIITRAEDWGDTRSTKQLGDFMIDIACNGQSVSPFLIFNNGETTLAGPFITTTTRSQFIANLFGGIGYTIRNVALDLRWFGHGGRVLVYEWQPSALIKTEVTEERATDWDTGGYNGMKWVQGCRICADTSGLNKNVQIQFTDQSLEPLVLNHDGEQTIAYWWTPHLAHEMRLIGTNAAGTDLRDWRLLKPIEWIFEPEPDIAELWEPQATSLDLPGYFHVQYILLPHRSTAELTLELNFDNGTADTYTVPASVNERVKYYVMVRARKGKLIKFRVTSSETFSIYMMDLEVRAKAWGITGSQYQSFKPFGDISRTSGGARI